MTILALDLGSKKTGIAISHGEMAEALKTYYFDKTGEDGLVSDLRKIVAEQKVEKLVIGLPLSLNGEQTDQSRKIKKQAEGIAEKLGLPFDFTQEALTSWEASESETNQKGIDAQAAKIILEQYLNEQRR